MNTSSRYGFKWSVNEVLSLQREFELLNWDIDTIANKHKRTPAAIMYKLEQEGFANYNVLLANYHSQRISTIDFSLENPNDDAQVLLDFSLEDSHDSYKDTRDNNLVANLSNKVYALEKIVTEIKDIIKQTSLSSNSNILNA
jgi:hypothetical protein